MKNVTHKPNLFIVGAVKSGTTALYNYLKLHPKIFFPEIKSPNYFGHDFPFKKDWYEGKIQQYLAFYSGVGSDKKWVGDASASYLHSQKAALEIKKFSPRAKIIIMLRKPVDMMYSLHSEWVYNGAEDIQDFEQALKAERGRKSGKIKTRTKYKNLLLYQEMASYYRPVKRYLNIFGSENVHVIIFKDFKENTPEVYRGVLRFLGLNDNFKIDFTKINSPRVTNPNKRTYLMFVQQFIEQPSSPVKYIARQLIPKKLRYKLITLITNLNTRFLPRDPIPLELRRKLQKKVRPDAEKLGRLINRDLSFWYRD